MKQIFSSILLLPALFTVMGCQPLLTGETYSRSEVRQLQQVEFGLIESIRIVQIEGTKTPIGTGTGAIIGGVIGNSIGGGSGKIIATVVGAVAGGIAGSAIEESVTKTQGVEITIRKDNGQIISIVQETSPNMSFSLGDRVRIISNNNDTRVVR
ncbi:MAG: glycine zipper 2TM domain-containing protein [gamma proteobacterium symbiont of Taylorina sp.]|nr:glycine zipper 2TM domain-containing protein [gamma proteobacterium symbiont of Taylorina sp.]